VADVDVDVLLNAEGPGDARDIKMTDPGGHVAGSRP